MFFILPAGTPAAAAAAAAVAAASCLRSLTMSSSVMSSFLSVSSSPMVVRSPVTLSLCSCVFAFDVVPFLSRKDAGPRVCPTAASDIQITIQTATTQRNADPTRHFDPHPSEQGVQ